jgi:hypothetical protein
LLAPILDSENRFLDPCSNEVCRGTGPGNDKKTILRPADSTLSELCVQSKFISEDPQMSCRWFLLSAWLTRNSTGVVFETVERHLRILADPDEVAVRITHVATSFPAAIVQTLGKEERSFVAPLFVAGPDVGDA